MKKYNVLIWGTGNWCRRLLGRLPSNCRVNAFVETNPVDTDFLGIPIISLEDYSKRNENDDLVIIAVKENSEILRSIEKSTGSLRNVFYMINEGDTLCPADGRGWFSINGIFDEKVYNARQQMYTSPYIVSEIDSNISMIVNSKNRMFLNGIIQGDIHQKNDISKFILLAEKYYGIEAKSKGIFMDIGANIGTTSIYMKKVINKNINILAFEMEHENCKQLKCNMILNDISEKEMCIVEAGVSNKNEKSKCMLSIREDNMGDHRIIKNGNYNEGWKTEEITTISLDEWIRNNDIDTKEIKYFWMDVQGHEGFVIDGGGELLKSHRIPLLMEFWPSELKRNKSFDLLLEKLNECGYSEFLRLDMIEDLEQVDSIIRPIEQLMDLGKELEECGSASQCDIFLIKK